MTIKLRFLNLLLAFFLLIGLINTASPIKTVQASNDIRISQVYGAGGNSGATYKNDFIELFNGGAASVNLNGWSLQYASYTGTSWSSKTILPNVTLLPGQYYLVVEAGGPNGAELPVVGDLTGTINLSNSRGKLILANTTTTLTVSCPLEYALDFIGFGAADCYEGTAPAPAISLTTAALRAGGGCIDTDDNSVDFSAMSPMPRNTASTLSPCVTDDAPMVSSTVPTAAATGVVVDSDISITFSEAVNGTGAWYELSCNNSGAHTAAISGGPTTFTLNPDIDFGPETCLVKIKAAQVTDQDLDDPPNTMVSDYSWTFQTAGADPTPPFVYATSPISGASSVPLNTGITITFNEPVEVDSSWVDVTCTESGTHTMIVNDAADPLYALTLDAGDTFMNGDVCTVTVDAISVSDEDVTVPGDNMLQDYFWNFSTNTCSETHIPISDVQGNGTTSPLNGTVVTVEGVVTADFQGTSSPTMNGFYIQSLPADNDGIDLTSEGLMIYDNSIAASIGDHLLIRGTVGEYQKQTELRNASLVKNCGYAEVPPAVDVDIPEVDTPGFTLERYEGMLVSINQDMTVQQNYFQGRYGQVTLGAGGRIAQLNNLTKGGGSLTDYTRMIVLDDANINQNPSPIPYYPSDGYLRAGDLVTYVEGILDEGGISSSSGTAWPYLYYRIQPTVAPTFDLIYNERPIVTPAVGGDLKVVGFNTLNFFTTLDNGINPGPYGGSVTPRGANNSQEFNRQIDKLVAAMTVMGADVYGLLELEAWDGANHGAGEEGTGAAGYLVGVLNATLDSPGRYAVVPDPVPGYFDPETEGDSDVIQVGLIYDTTTIRLVGDSLSVNDTIFDRSPFAQEFEEIATGEQFVVVANHFKSKGSCPTNGSLDEDQGDGQGCWNIRRTLQAAALLQFINNSLVPLDPDVMVIGDLNAYGAEDPIQELIDGGLVNQIAAFVPVESRYSFVFDGTAGYLDHALTTASMTPHISGVDFFHINADEPSVIDYNTEFKGPGYSPDLWQNHMYRSSDHDPVFVGLQLAPAKPVISSIDLPGPYIPGITREFNVTVDNPVAGMSINQAILQLTIRNASTADITLFQYYDADVSKWVDVSLSTIGSDLQAYYPATAFTLTSPYTETIQFQIQFINQGAYPFEFRLVDIGPDPDLLLAYYGDNAVVPWYVWMPFIVGQ